MTPERLAEIEHAAQTALRVCCADDECHYGSCGQARETLEVAAYVRELEARAAQYEGALQKVTRYAFDRRTWAEFREIHRIAHGALTPQGFSDNGTRLNDGDKAHPDPEAVLDAIRESRAHEGGDGTNEPSA